MYFVAAWNAAGCRMAVWSATGCRVVTDGGSWWILVPSVHGTSKRRLLDVFFTSGRPGRNMDVQKTSFWRRLKDVQSRPHMDVFFRSFYDV